MICLFFKTKKWPDRQIKKDITQTWGKNWERREQCVCWASQRQKRVIKTCADEIQEVRKMFSRCQDSFRPPGHESISTHTHTHRQTRAEEKIRSWWFDAVNQAWKKSETSTQSSVPALKPLSLKMLHTAYKKLQPMLVLSFRIFRILTLDCRMQAFQVIPCRPATTIYFIFLLPILCKKKTQKKTQNENKPLVMALLGKSWHGRV